MQVVWTINGETRAYKVNESVYARDPREAWNIIRNVAHGERNRNVLSRTSDKVPWMPTITPITKRPVFKPIAGKSFRSGSDNDYPNYAKSGKFHGGRDIGAPEGTPIVASFSGKIINANWGSGYGKHVVIESVVDGMIVRTLYGHMSATAGIALNTEVKAGTVIGYVGHTGNCIPAGYNHLHIEMRTGNFSYNDQNNRLDPAKYIK